MKIFPLCGFLLIGIVLAIFWITIFNFVFG